MTPADLQDKLVKFIEEEIAGSFSFKTNKDTITSPKVIKGAWLLPEESEAFPYIAVHVKEGEDTVEQSTVKVFLYFGAYSEGQEVDGKMKYDTQGYLDVFNMIERTRQALLSTLVIGKKYKLELPLKWHIPHEQAWPHWVGWMETNWLIEKVLFEGDY